MTVPAAPDVIKPVVAPIVAIKVLLLLHVPPVTASLKVALAPMHKDETPDIAAGEAITKIFLVAAVPHPVA